MKLAAKVVSLVVVVITIVLVLDSYLLVQREREHLSSDALREARFFGRVLQTAVAAVGGSGDVARVQDLIEAINQVDHLELRWLGSPGEDELGRQYHLTAAQREELRNSGVVTLRAPSADRLITLVQAGPARVAVEVVQSLAQMTATGRVFRVRVLTLTVAMVLLSFFLIGVVGTVLLGRPLRELTHYARRIGSGDLTGRLGLKRSDELGELASAMNQMSDDLARAQDRVQKEVEARVQALRQLRHEDRLRTVGRLAAGIAHELGTPLNVVSGRAAMIASGELEPEETTRSAEIIRNQTTRMTTIIRQLLDFARRRPLQKSPVKLRELTRQALELLRPIARKSGVTLAVCDGQELVAIADPGQIQQVLANLIINAIQAMPSGGTVELDLSRQTAAAPGGSQECACALIRVRDQGVGIAEADIPNIFEPFFTTKDVGQGSGLGLSIVHGIVKEHGGWIEVESKPGQGSTFLIFLPLEEVE